MTIFNELELGGGEVIDAHAVKGCMFVLETVVDVVIVVVVEVSFGELWGDLEDGGGWTDVVV